MKPKTQEFLNLLLWSADLIARPTFRNLTDSYEGWAYRNGLQRQLDRLAEKKLIERDIWSADDGVYRLTEQGRLCSLGGRDPLEYWSRDWDGRWRLILFDVPMARNSRRVRMRRYLRGKGFGYLQNSAWITPHPVEEERKILMGAEVDVESLMVMEARPCGGESDADIVAGAWDFDRINAAYVRHLEILKLKPAGTLREQNTAKAFQRWAAAELEAWLAAVAMDPLLPKSLLPPGYLGRQAWDRRSEAFRRVGKLIRGFQDC